MRAKVTPRGITVPCELLHGFDEVEIRRGENFVLICPAEAEDPIRGLGVAPAVSEVDDASAAHDRHLYGQ